MMAVAVIDMDAVGRGLDAKVIIAHAFRELVDLLGRAREGLEVVQLDEPGAIAFRRGAVGDVASAALRSFVIPDGLRRGPIRNSR